MESVLMPNHNDADHQQVFARLYEDHRTSMLAYATAILGGDSSAAEDAVDEGFTDLWRGRERWNTITNMPAFLRRIIRNKAIDILRKSHARDHDNNEDAILAISDSAPDPEQSAMIGDQQQWLRGALKILNADQREAIVLCYFEGLPLQEIADAMDCPTNTVKTRLHHARRKLHDWMASNAEAYA